MDKKLIHRLSRVQGQIEALKLSLEEGSFSEEKCLANLQLLKASINGLKKFGAAYMASNVHNCLQKNMPQEELEAVMQLAIETGFDL